MSEVSARAPFREDQPADPPNRPASAVRQPAPDDIAAAGGARADDGGQPKEDEAPPPRRRRRVLPVLLTLCLAGIAAFAGWLLWTAYMASPWTRDGAVRVYVVTGRARGGGAGSSGFRCATTSSSTRATS